MAENKKRTYEKMTIEKVSLIPEDAILGVNCKTTNSSGSWDDACSPTDPCFDNSGQ